MSFQINADNFEYRVWEETNQLGARRFVVQLVCRDDSYPPEPRTREFKTRRQATRYAAKQTVALLSREWREV